MKHKPDIKLLKKFLETDPLRKAELAVNFKLSSTNAIDQWLSRGKLPTIRRGSILKYIKEGMIEDARISRAS